MYKQLSVEKLFEKKRIITLNTILEVILKLIVDSEYILTQISDLILKICV